MLYEVNVIKTKIIIKNILYIILQKIVYMGTSNLPNAHETLFPLVGCLNYSPFSCLGSPGVLFIKRGKTLYKRSFGIDLKPGKKILS